jgi:hypothetical protein
MARPRIGIGLGDSSDLTQEVWSQGRLQIDRDCRMGIDAACPSSDGDLEIVYIRGSQSGRGHELARSLPFSFLEHPGLAINR